VGARGVDADAGALPASAEKANAGLLGAADPEPVDGGATGGSVAVAA
jgi:hypothetical protein